MYSFSSTTTQLAMKTAHQKSHRKHFPSATKCAMALQAIHRQQTITALSRQYHCSRTTVHAQKNRALEAAANAFGVPRRNRRFFRHQPKCQIKVFDV
jgi:transposase-like protein